MSKTWECVELASVPWNRQPGRRSFPCCFFLSRVLSCRLLVVLGDYSANMYLIHQVVYGYFFYYGLMEGTAGTRIALMLLNYVLTFALAAGFQILMKRWAERKKYIKKTED